MPRSTRFAQKTVRNPQIPDAGVRFSPLGLKPDFPLEVVLDGVRDDAPISHLHIHDAFEFGCCLEGSGTFYVGAKIITFRAGDMTVLTDREFHRCRSSPGTQSRWTWFFFEPVRLLVPHVTPSLRWEPERFTGARFVNVLPAERFPQVAEIARLLMAESRRSDGWTRENLRALLLLLINELHRSVPKPRRAQAGDLSAQAVARIAPALHHIAGAFHEQLTIPDLARRCGMGVRSFQDHFQRIIGHSPQTHLQQSRIRAAAALLAQVEKPIAEIAFACGFNTLSAFNRAFRATYRTSPRAYRRDPGAATPAR
jgi:AraC-like DNA-binding protein